MREALAFGAWRAERDASGTVHIGRAHPLDPAAALVGAPAAAAPGITKALHGLCPMAHAIAVRRALEAAGGKRAPAGLEAARVVALEAEAAAAAAFRFGALWPTALGFKPDPLAGVARRAAEALIRAVYEGSPDDESGPALARALLSLIKEGPVRVCLEAATALRDVPDPDRPGDGLYDRMAALALDAQSRASACGALRADGAAAPPEPVSPVSGFGRGAAPAVRGPVFVDLGIEKGLIVQARINTPTDRVLAEGGPLSRALAQAPAALAPLIVLAFDPCAPVRCVMEPLNQKGAAYA